MVTIKDGCGCDPCDCDWKQKLKEAYSRAIQSVNKIGDETGRVYFPDGTGFVKMPLPTKEQIDSIAEIDGIKASVDELNKTVPALETQVTGVTESLVSNVEVLNGTTAGKFKVRIEREKAALIDSNDYDLSKVNSIELIQGSGPAMVKAQLTLSDGTVLRSDDFVFTTEAIGTDVYISSFVFKNGNVAGTISADIGLNNGTTLEANNFLVPTDPNVISSITDLQTRTEALEQNVIDINNKADLDNVNQTIVAKQLDAESIVRVKGQNENQTEFTKFGIIGGKPNSPFGITQEKEVFGKVGDYPIGAIAVLDSSGNPMNFTGGETWEEVDLSNYPTDWKAGDKVKIILTVAASISCPSWTTEPVINGFNVNPSYKNTAIVELEIPEVTTNYVSIPFYAAMNQWAFTTIVIREVSGYNHWNNNESDKNIIKLIVQAFNAGGTVSGGINIPLNSATAGITKMWRLKK